MSSRQDRPGSGRDRTGPEAGTSIAIGAAVGGLAGLIWALVRKKKTLGDSEDSPIIIKSGSLSLAVKDINGKITGNSHQYEVTSSDFSGKAEWDVSVAELVAGYPWKTPVPHAQVSSVVLEVVEDDSTALDTITVTFVNEVLIVRAANDTKFGDKTKVRDPANSSSKTHKLRAMSKEVKNKKDFEIASITVNHATGSSVYAPAFDYALALTFR